ncbi:MAG: autotransporter-associated beta strand repeat-containing protein [Kiritimatiellae bacterium]|jgi:fibronectin-binding autotransporter adhesin|nr:autotransporter-associated beta strand repeat-containing protein [Kiritimatiellia bacterium]
MMKRMVMGLSVFIVVFCGLPLLAAEIVKQNNTDPLDAGSSWVGGNVPGTGDEAVWDSTVTAANSSALTGPVTWNGLKLTDPGGPITVTGTEMLTLDGGATYDINLSTAQQNLTVETPLTMLPSSSQINVAAGRTLTFKGLFTFTASGTCETKGTGTMVMDGPVLSSFNTTLELEKGTTVLTGVGGNLVFTGGGSRLYIGRNSGNGTLIVSNGFHLTSSVNDEASANFVGVGAWGHLFIEGGSLTLQYLREAINGGSGEIVVNDGTLDIWGGSETAVRSGYALMIGNNHQDSTASSSGSGSLTVNGGEVFCTNGIIKIASDSASSSGHQEVTLNGGELALKRFYVGESVQVSKTVTLNGGILRLTGKGNLFDGPGAANSTLTVNVGDGGALIDTGVNDVTNTPALLADGTGGLTKSGSGTLTLKGVNTYTGLTRVLEGLLRFSGVAATLRPDLAVASRAGVSMADGVLTTFAPSSLIMGNASSASTLELELAASGSGADILAVPAAATLGRVAFTPLIQGTKTRASKPGDYLVLTYSGSDPDISLFSVADPAVGRAYTFILDSGNKRVTMRIAYAAGVSEWIAPGSGAWETAGNWTVAPPNTAGTSVRFGDAITAPATVTAAAPVTVGEINLDSVNACTLAGGGYTFDNGSDDSSVTVVKGRHTVAAAVTLAGDLSVEAALYSHLTLDGVVSGSGMLVKQGTGELRLTQANTYSGGTLFQGGAILLDENASLGTGQITTDGYGGFRMVASTPLTLTNDWVIAESVIFNTVSNDLSLTGSIDWHSSSRGITKNNENELVLSGTGDETEIARFKVENGLLRFSAGADFNLLSIGTRDVINMKAANIFTREVVIDSGAQVTVAGIDMDSGAANTVTVNGGELTLLGGGASNDAIAMKGNGTGVDRFIVNSGSVVCSDGTWVGVGFRIGDAYLTVNGGTSTMSRVSLGARDMNLDLSARSFVEINGGVLEVSGTFNWMGSSTVGRTNRLTLGNSTPGSGVWRTCATANPRYALNNMPILTFDGGILETLGLASIGGSSLSDYLYGAKEVYVGPGGARIDTLGLDVTIKQALQQGAVPDGGMTKLGAGTLTLDGACNFTGATVVYDGSLLIPSVYASTGLVVNSGAMLNLANGVIQTLTLDAATLTSGAMLTFEAVADGNACDQIGLPSGASIGDLTIAILQINTQESVSRPGDYAIFTFAGSAPDVSGWTLLNPPAGRTADFVIVGSNIVLRVAYETGIAIWTTDGSGAWETAGNWTALPGNATGAVVRLGDAITAPSTVTLAGSSTLGYLAFNNDAAYTVAGAALILENTNSQPAVVSIENGMHVINSALNAGGDFSVQVAEGAGVAANGGVSVSGTLTVAGPGTLAVADSAALSVTDLALSGQGGLVVSNSTVFSLPVALGSGGGAFVPGLGQTIDLQGSVIGSGGLIVDGSGFLMVTNANGTFAGIATANAGTLRLDTLPAGGLSFGQGTLDYIGGSTVTAGGYTLDTGNAARAGVLQADGNITFQGNVSALSGALVKTGPGTVTFTASGENVFSADLGAGYSQAVLDIGEYGDSPTVGFGGFSIANGTVVLGAAGQTNTFAGPLVVGLNSTTNADAETAGILEIIEGVTTLEGSLIIGNSNGNTNTAPVGRSSKLKVTGGEFTVESLIMGRAENASNHNAAPELEMTGGKVTVTGICHIPEQIGAVATVTLSGGTFDYLAAQGSSLRFGEYGGEADITVSGTAVLSSGMNFFIGYGAGSKATLHLDGGTVIAQNLDTGEAAEGYLVFNGGVLRPSEHNNLLGTLTSATVSSGGAVIDLSLIDDTILHKTLTHEAALGAVADGGLTKTGTGMLTIDVVQAYDGPTVISEGTLVLPVLGVLSNVTALTVSPGATLLLNKDAVQTLALGGLTLGTPAAAAANITLAFAMDGTSHDVLAVNGDVSLGVAAFTLQRLVAHDAFGLNGTYTLMTYTGSDPVVTGLSVTNPLYGKIYTFAAASGSVTLTISSDYTGASYVWSATTGGAWETAGNWALAPGAGGAGTPVLFDNALTSPGTVAVNSAVTLGEVTFNHTHAYTLSGTTAMSLDNGSGTQAVVSVESGTHSLDLPLILSGDGLTVDAVSGSGLTLGGALSGSGVLVKQGAGQLSVTEVNTRTGLTELEAGTLVLQDGGTPGAGELVVNGAQGLRVSGSSATVLANDITLKTDTEIDTQDADLTLSGALDWQSAVEVVSKVGTNELILAGTGGSTSGAPSLNVRAGGLTLASGADYSLDGAIRTSIRLGAGAGAATSMTIEEGASLTAGGINAKSDGNTVPGCDALIVQNGGDVHLTHSDALFVRHEGTAPATYVMNGGTLSMPQSSWANVGLSGLGIIEVNGGVMSLGRFAPGYQNRSTVAGSGNAFVTVNGGRLETTGSWSWMSDGNPRLTDVTVNGGTLSLPATKTYGLHASRWTGLTLNGGTLELLGDALDSTAADDYLSGLRRVALGANRSAIDTMGHTVTIQQNLLALTNSGGIAKIGTGTLTLSNINAVRGLADVQEGTLKARFAHRDLPATPLLWLPMDSIDNQDVSGNGFAVSTLGSGCSQTNRTANSAALMLDGSCGFAVPYNSIFTNVASYSIAAWIRISFIAPDSDQSIMSARTGSSRALEIKLNGGDSKLRILQHSYSSESWWQELRTANPVPINQWIHVAVAITPEGAAMYLNGVRQSMIQVVGTGGTIQAYPGGWPFEGDIRLMPVGSKGIITVGKTTTTSGQGFRGMMDEVMLFERVLSDDEVAALAAETPLARVSVRAAALGTLDLMGEAQQVSGASGSGEFVNGTLVVQDQLAVGDADDDVPGALLTASNLTLVSNMVYACSCDGVSCDLTQVEGLLTVDGPGVIDFGRTEANPLAGTISVTVMTYNTISGVANFADWDVTGLGRRGFEKIVEAADGEVVVNLRSLYGTLLILR